MGKSVENILKTCDFEAVLRYYAMCKSLDAKARWVDVALQIQTVDPSITKGYKISRKENSITEKFPSAKTDWTQFIDTQGIDLLDSAKEKVYLFRFYDSHYNFVCSKVGTTTRKVLQRLREELSSDTYKKLDCTYAIIDRVYNCSERPAEGLESFIRAEYIRLHPGAFKKNDRFMNVIFDFPAVDALVETYNDITRKD